MRHLRQLASVTALVPLLAGCGGSPLALDAVFPPPAGRFVSSMTASGRAGGPARPVTVRLDVANESGKDVVVMVDCNTFDLHVVVVGPDGQVVRHVDPGRAWLACAPPTTYPPGRRTVEQYVFGGRLWTEAGDPYAAGPGVYSVLYRTSWHFTDGTGMEAIEHAVSFYWAGP